MQGLALLEELVEGWLENGDRPEDGWDVEAEAGVFYAIECRDHTTPRWTLDEIRNAMLVAVADQIVTPPLRPMLGRDAVEAMLLPRFRDYREAAMPRESLRYGLLTVTLGETPLAVVVAFDAHAQQAECFDAHGRPVRNLFPLVPVCPPLEMAAALQVVAQLQQDDQRYAPSRGET